MQDKKKPKIIVVDDKPKKKQKKVYNHDNLFDDDPFPDFVVTNDPFERMMIKAANKDRDINKQSSDINSRYQNMISSQMVQDYEGNTILPPSEFRDKPVPAPRTYKPRPPIPTPRTYKPVPTPRTKIEQTDKALKGYTKSYEISIKNNKDPLAQMQNTRMAIEYHTKNILTLMKGLKFVETLKVVFSKMSGDEIIFKTAYFNSTAKTIINQTEIHEALEMSKQEIINKIAQWVSEGSGWTIQSVDNHYLNIVKYMPLRGGSYIPLPKELQNSAKGLINMKNEDDECFRWCHIRHLNPQDKTPQRIKKSDKEYVDKLDYSGIEFPVTTDKKKYEKIEKQNEININVFVYNYENKIPYPIYLSKDEFEDHMDLLLITKDEKKHYVLIKDFNKFMYNQTKHKEKKHFCKYCLQCFSSERVLNNHKENCIQVNGTQAVNMPKKGENFYSLTTFINNNQYLLLSMQTLRL